MIKKNKEFERRIAEQEQVIQEMKRQHDRELKHLKGGQHRSSSQAHSFLGDSEKRSISKARYSVANGGDHQNEKTAKYKEVQDLKERNAELLFQMAT